MGALEQNIAESNHVIIGQKITLQWNVDQSDGSTAQNMNGWTVQFVLMDRRGGTAYMTKTCTVQNGDATDDQAEAVIAAADWATAGISESDTLFYTVSRTDEVVPLAFGSFTVHKALATA